jgi:hypothetical protein
MINIDAESLLTLSEATKFISVRFRNGRPLHLSTLHRWSLRGIRGVRLESIVVCGTKCTSVEALQRFFTRLAGDDGAAAAADSPTVPSAPASPSASPATTAARQRRVAAAKDELTRMGV